MSALALAACFFVLSASAVAAGPRSATAPAYPGNTIKVERKSPIVAGTKLQVKLSGHAQWKGATDSLTTPYALYLYVQNAAVAPNCSAGYDGQLQTSINLPLNASGTLGGFVVNGSLNVTPAVPNPGIDWSIKSLPFTVKLGVKHVLLCAYAQYITDDVAFYQLPVTVSAPSCRPSRRRLRRGARLGLKCNVSGPVRLRLRRPGSRRVKVIKGRISTRDGRARLSTRRLSAGHYRATAYTGNLRLGKTFRLRLR